MKESKRDWLFRVQMSHLEKNEVVYVVGNLPELGAWNHNQAILMSQEHSSRRESPIVFDNSNSSGEFYTEDGQDNAADSAFDDEKEEDGRVFSQKVALPIDADIEFRYFIAVICQSNGAKNSAKTLIIRKWETHMAPRLIRKNTPSNFTEDILPDPDKFGYYNGYYKIERGWLTDETVIQFKLFNNPIKLWKNRLQNRKVHIKMTPVNLVRHNSLELQQFGGDCVDDSLSMDTQDIVDQPAFTSITEIAVMNDEEARFKFQEQFGRPYDEDEFVIFNVAVRYPEMIAYLVDYYVYSSRCYPGEPPNHIGFSYILPSTLQSSVGLLTVPITSTKHRPIGQLTVEYVVIKPIPDYPWDMSISYAKHWEQRWSGLDVGHRGLGTSFKFETKNCANVRENTIASLKTAAYHGADMVEFDVQLSKDHIPVIYHDFYVSISLKRKKQIEAMDMLEIPVKDLTLEQLHLLKDYCYPGDSLGKVLYFVDKAEQGVNRLVYHVAEGREKNPRFFDEDLEDHQPFPTLQTVLQELEQHVGCNIEIKWTMQLKDGTFELNHPFDLNLYLDIILKVVLEYGGDRKIVFSCFNPDICAMIRLKQNKYPVVFLTQGVTLKYPTYHDSRCQTIPMAMRHALAADILGINVHTEDILRDPSQVKLVKDAGLIIFCWGDDNNDKATIQHLKKLGLHAVIYDKIDEYNAKEVKESIFLVNARENQKELIALAQCNQTTQPPMPLNTEKDFYLDRPSTTTSLGKNSSIGGDSIYSVPALKLSTSCERQESIEISEMTKDFSVCANTFGHSMKTKSIPGLVCGQPTVLPEIYGEDEAAKDCL
ncbi:glycerophosphocholine phosphodiesterase GPCPD1 isoform X1 [Harpegnathos saltator]|uniref:Putative glycerophosphodiester phosphodiesterase 5 n=1 Tax=Harpegnathos saltator TaxID=610380 RepID=E2BUY4_HARSA|nr:glycerophosphocholine phosphodiesterase GPCPD1 isoform X1 [Harpegnathos saltator]XP_011145570.1 glycerophosphocholine phosphodiesterase GPCPD1 isoform X1 [Harpegnathos saltator]XP_011145571.1 glycerophosphocholine phosphodiesterase GPCPD1 isoform X1 [Harpegnathos saltator]XP_019698600.1 glycerophosphocholine phosphodiesterase GPCPD1 isoform X1 [Harpegnathos saltator]EFN80521.1 Putative glycerophosphodiester phosphodiesterase 5 [Harpegnathos saltator]